MTPSASVPSSNSTIVDVKVLPYKGADGKPRKCRCSVNHTTYYNIIKPQFMDELCRIYTWSNYKREQGKVVLVLKGKIGKHKSGTPFMFIVDDHYDTEWDIALGAQGAFKEGNWNDFFVPEHS